MNPKLSILKTYSHFLFVEDNMVIDMRKEIAHTGCEQIITGTLDDFLLKPRHRKSHKVYTARIFTGNILPQKRVNFNTC